VGVLVLLLVLTNLVTLGVLAWYLLRPTGEEPDQVVAAALDDAPRPTGALGVRRVITIEILNPIELAGSRGRVAGIAGSLVPSITRRVVYDQALKQIRRDMREYNVIADVRLHTIRPATEVTTTSAFPTQAQADEPAQAQPSGRAQERPDTPVYYDEIRRIDLDHLGERGA
jgi:hypothetical protein